MLTFTILLHVFYSLIHIIIVILLLRYKLSLAQYISPAPLAHCSTASAMSLFFAQSGHRMSSASVMNPLPTMDVLHDEQRKQSLCQCRPSNEMKRVPPMPKDTPSHENNNNNVSGMLIWLV